MIDENLKEMSCKSKEYYKNITSIEVTPVQRVNFDDYLLYRKGEKIVKKRLFRKPIITTAKEDIYKVDGEKRTANGMASYWSTIYDEEKNAFFRKGMVRIYFGKERETQYFKTNEDIRYFVSDLREKCKKCGNELL